MVHGPAEFCPPRRMDREQSDDFPAFLMLRRPFILIMVPHLKRWGVAKR